MKFWMRIIINTLLFIALAGFFKNMFFVSDIWIALVASLILAVLNALVRPILYILSLPITVLTLGLFSIVINAVMLQLTAFFIGNSFRFSSFGASLLMAVLMSICNTIISSFVTSRKS
ncbi:phage holin family protein [Secundilactobacillus malefermentans]|uniref:Phage holin family protein n=1 Tax=Secundilactobacillus malefermentans TaxID=176292 RepID=A0A4R5NER0_9LACO|nr:phage holin family protein [Secundilactobacillus malefermentans]QEA32049.1 phage holin family protein [Secundilactobacillus malefermentans]TDG71532.1 hypothetical protein C5L31_001749 [Secundilactobacillus malefermentans]